MTPASLRDAVRRHQLHTAALIQPETPCALNYTMLIKTKDSLIYTH